MTRAVAAYPKALLAVAAVTWITAAQLPLLGLASSAMLFLLPVLISAVRGGVGPGLTAALAGAAAYNFFLLEPRYTFRVHQLDNLVSLLVLVAVALVTSRLASRLMMREAEAVERARLSDELAELSGLLSGHPAQPALERGIALLEARYGKLELLLPHAGRIQENEAFSSLDASAAAWSAHNGDITGHGTETMPVADWTFLPLSPRNRHDISVMALARPMDGTVRAASELDHLRQLAMLLGQCLDRDALEAERRERELLEERDRLRRTLLASLAHDFRTPLTIITGRLAELASGNPAATDALAAAQRMDRMMNDLIGAARIEAGALEPVLESIDLVDVVGAACEGLIQPHGVALKQSIPADLPFVRGDPVLLQHLIANLIDNGICHARSTVVVSAAKQSGLVLLRVSDDGPGIPEGERQRIFERFARIEGTDRTQGSGLGLAIVKGFGDVMGMAVTVTSAPSGGALFTVAMPRAGRAGT